MIKHIVCFKLKEGEDIDKAIEVLLSMKGKVPSALEIKANKDFLRSARSYDIILEVTLKDKKSLEEYQQDKYHCEVVKKHMHAVYSSSIAVDYEF